MLSVIKIMTTTLVASSSLTSPAVSITQVDPVFKPQHEPVCKVIAKCNATGRFEFLMQPMHVGHSHSEHTGHVEDQRCRQRRKTNRYASLKERRAAWASHM